ncbi:uncharacterized protein LOC107322855 [Coturnix japonica]|uniref:uncharacterized protein LOC107322855 n=1 Tax=Coturnix japonica TaxID=93934 RepID=UPI000777B805|nr:uncharacterized protein LOC107322855 [Coturnix japonica]
MKLPLPELLHHLLCHTPPYVPSLSFVFHPFCPCSSVSQHIPSFLLILLYPQSHPFPLSCALPLAMVSHTTLFCSYIIHISLLCFPYSTALHSLPLFLCISIFYHIPPFQSSCCPLFPIPSSMLLHHSSCFISPNCFSITHNLLFILPSTVLHFSILPSPATSSFLAPSSPTTCCPSLCSTITYLPFLLPVTCHLTSVSDPSLPCSSVTQHVLFILTVLLHHSPCPHSFCASLSATTSPHFCHLRISFFPAMFSHWPSPISPSCVPPSPTTSHPIPCYRHPIFSSSHLPVSSVLILHHLVLISTSHHPFSSSMSSHHHHILLYFISPPYLYPSTSTSSILLTSLILLHFPTSKSILTSHFCPAPPAVNISNPFSISHHLLTSFSISHQSLSFSNF